MNISNANIPPAYGDGPGRGAESMARMYCGVSSSKRSQAEHTLLVGRDVSRSLSSVNIRLKHFLDVMPVEDAAASGLFAITTSY